MRAHVLCMCARRTCVRACVRAYVRAGLSSFLKYNYLVWVLRGTKVNISKKLHFITCNTNNCSAISFKFHATDGATVAA